MFENYITKIYRFIKKIGLNKLGFIFILFLIKPIIFVLAKTKKLSLFPQENWGTKLRYLLGWYEHETVIISKKYIKPGMKRYRLFYPPLLQTNRTNRHCLGF